mmetsp:Transcript_20024/g.61692  ORF Transcript_20024/g.61692 Transcript_20024/m.61692 type:complete len:196 (-) Transcript_20024:10-597(-)
MPLTLLLVAAAAALSPVHEALQNRRTTHNFAAGRPIPNEVLTRAIECAVQAPNHRLTEPWRFRSLGRESIEAIAALHAASITDPDKAAKKAARWSAIENWLVITSRITPDDELLTREDYAATCCAVQNLQLSFAADGVGTKWTSGDIQRTPEFEEICGVSDRERVVGVVWYGYADGDPKQARRKLSVDDVLTRVP